MSNKIEKKTEDEILAMALENGNEEVFKLLTETPGILKAICDNAFGAEIVEIVTKDPSRMAEFRELIEELKSGELEKSPLPKKLLN